MAINESYDLFQELMAINESYRAGWIAFRGLLAYNPEGWDRAEYDRGWRDARYRVQC